MKSFGTSQAFYLCFANITNMYKRINLKTFTVRGTRSKNGKTKMIKYKDKESIKRHKPLFCIRTEPTNFYVRLRESNYHKLHILPDFHTILEQKQRNHPGTLLVCIHISKNKKGEKMFKVKDQDNKKKTTTQYHYYQNRVS